MIPELLSIFASPFGFSLETAEEEKCYCGYFTGNCSTGMTVFRIPPPLPDLLSDLPPRNLQPTPVTLSSLINNKSHQATVLISTEGTPDQSSCQNYNNLSYFQSESRSKVILDFKTVPVNGFNNVIDDKVYQRYLQIIYQNYNLLPNEDFNKYREILKRNTDQVITNNNKILPAMKIIIESNIIPSMDSNASKIIDICNELISRCKMVPHRCSPATQRQVNCKKIGKILRDVADSFEREKRSQIPCRKKISLDVGPASVLPIMLLGGILIKSFYS